MFTGTTREYIELRAKQSNVLDKINFAPEFDDEGMPLLAPSSNDWPYQITGIFDGALEYEEYVITVYEVNIADWIAELYAETATEGQSWDIIVAEYAYEDAGRVIYRIGDQVAVEIVVNDGDLENPR